MEDTKVISLGGATENLTIFSTNYQKAIECNAREFKTMISLRAPEREEEDMNEETRAPVVISAVLDCSGSMAGEKMAFMKDTMKFVVEEMRAKDSLCIVEYDTHVNVTFPMTKMTQDAKEKALRVVERIRQRGCTNLSGGLMAGLENIPQITEDCNNRVASVLLMTDGLANEGLKTAPEISNAVKKQYPNPQFTIQTFGFGSDHNAEFLRSISDITEGMYYYIENRDQIADCFADCLGGLMSMAAQQIELEITAAPGVKISTVCTAKLTTDVVPGEKILVAMGDIQQGEERDIPIVVQLPESAVGTFNIGTVKLTYFDVVESEMVTRDVRLDITRKDAKDLTEDDVAHDANVARQYCRYLGAQALKNASTAAESNNLDGGKTILQDVVKCINEESIVQGDDTVNNLLDDIKDSLKNMESRAQYREKGQYKANMQFKKWGYQRCAAISSNEAEECVAYETKARKCMKSKAKPSMQFS